MFRTLLPLADLQDRQERLLWDIDPADTFHPALAFFLLLEQLPLACDVAAVALREYVFSHCCDVLARDNLVSDRGLERDLEHLPRYKLPEPLNESLSALIRQIFVNDDRQGVNRFAGHQD